MYSDTIVRSVQTNNFPRAPVIRMKDHLRQTHKDKENDYMKGRVFRMREERQPSVCIVKPCGKYWLELSKTVL